MNELDLDPSAPDDSVAQPTRGARRGRRLTVAALVTVGLVGAGAAYAATSAGASAPAGNSTSSSAPAAPTGAPKPPTGTAKPPTGTAKPPTPKPHLDGTVISVSGDTITVKDPEGFTRVIAVSSSTTYTSNGSKSTISSVVAGRFVHAEGTVDANGTSLDASTLAESTSRPTPPAGGPAGGPGRAGMPRPGVRPVAGATPPSGARSGAPSGAPRGVRPASGATPPAGVTAPSAAPSAASTAHGS